ncbi:MAG: hypothetical protein RMI94_11685 [Bryobacterales bacterium]|nr:hypothetical protein [Bryobacterales bacterium]
MKRIALLAGIAAAPAVGQPSDTVYYNAKIITMWPGRPLAQALAIRGNRFLAVGTNEEIPKYAGQGTRRVDLGGRCVVPGLIDSHTHPASAALSEQQGPVPVMNTIAEVQAYVR